MSSTIQHDLFIMSSSAISLIGSSALFLPHGQYSITLPSWAVLQHIALIFLMCTTAFFSHATDRIVLFSLMGSTAWCLPSWAVLQHIALIFLMCTTAFFFSCHRQNSIIFPHGQYSMMFSLMAVQHYFSLMGSTVLFFWNSSIMSMALFLSHAHHSFIFLKGQCSIIFSSWAA